MGFHLSEQDAAAFGGRHAIAAAGATEVQLGEGRTIAMIRLSEGDVPSASIVTPEAAETFPPVVHVPLTPRSEAGASVPPQRF